LERGDALALADGDDLTLEPVWEAVGLSLDGNTLEVTLHAGERATLANELPAGIRYSVTELVPTGWSEVGTDGVVGSVTSGGAHRASATNAYGMARATIRGTKHVEGSGSVAGHAFDLYEVGAGGALTRCGEATSGADGTFAFGALSYADTGTHRYVVLERVGTGGAGGNTVVWDVHAEHVTVEVTRDATGALGASVVTDDDGVVFTNAGRRSALAVTKTVETPEGAGGAGASRDFPVTVDVSGGVLW
jgi:pilin isopeptide linkage protein